MRKIGGQVISSIYVTVIMSSCYASIYFHTWTTSAVGTCLKATFGIILLFSFSMKQIESIQRQRAITSTLLASSVLLSLLLLNGLAIGFSMDSPATCALDRGASGSVPITYFGTLVCLAGPYRTQSLSIVPSSVHTIVSSLLNIIRRYHQSQGWLPSRGKP